MNLNPVNPEAGDHAMPADPAVLAAALRAAEKAWAEFPYLSSRFGERGMRFTRSDSGWLATLTELTQDQVYDQTAWLSRVLTFRGIPSLILEVHLDFLSAEIRLLPEPNGHEKLRLAAESLRAARARVVAPDTFARLSRELEAAVRDLGFPARSADVLLSAFADEAGGLSGAKEKTQNWFESVLSPSHAVQFRDALTRIFRKARETSLT